MKKERREEDGGLQKPCCLLAVVVWGREKRGEGWGGDYNSIRLQERVGKGGGIWSTPKPSGIKRLKGATGYQNKSDEQQGSKK